VDTEVAVGGPGHAPLADRYELGELLATGGMGQVWRARDLRLGRTVAVKVLRSEFSGNATFLARFRAEAQHAAVLAHENIAAVHDYGEVPAADGSGRLAYLVMELVDGEPLSALLAREGRLDAARTLALLRQTAAALAAAHEAGVVHRDVKPGNLLVAPDGRVTVTDFGIAWSAASVPLTQTGQVVGTAHYLSPEQAEGAKATPASDVYALGMIAYECLAGRRAFDGDNAVQIALRQIRDVPDPLPGDVPDPVRTLVGRMLLKDPAARFADGAAVRAAVDDVLAGRYVAPGRLGDGGTRPLDVVWPATPSAAMPLRRRTLRRRVLGPAAALLAGAGIAVAGVQLLDPPAPAPVAAATTERPEAPPTGVVVAAADHVGRPVDDVEADLAALGLRVERVAEETRRAEPGTVLAVTPTGALAPGDLVTVTYAVPPPPPPSPPPAPTTAAPPPAAVVVAGTGADARTGPGVGSATDDGTGNRGDAKDGNGKRGKGKGKGNGGNGRGNGRG
jgi:serine/threonine-protein kinase